MQGEGGEELTIEELASNLSTYKEQLQQVKEVLAHDPGNSEYADVERELHEVIAMTEELLATAKQNQNFGLEIGTRGSASPSFPQSQKSENDAGSISDYHNNFAPGTKVQAVWSEDGEWYEATIDSLTPNGYYVTYDGWGNKEEVDPANVRPIQEGAVNALLEAEKVAEATKQAIKRKIAQAASVDFQSRSLPAKLRIEPDDPEDVKIAKRKKIHAFKSKMRMEQLEVTQNKRQNAWQQFQTTKGKTKKSGYLSGRKRESIFKSPDDPFGKVGVTGSGKGLTDFQKREKHLHLKGGAAENDDEAP
ncbi:putative chromatin remodeling & transcriptional activation CHROMO-DOMAIN family [Rosa chinensis]|uniref:Survival of motor neuron-related-splicing factor 30 n=2 Tax=Rosa chinensis TaxID=74649 RepID=A0A2P6PCL1_ROSCH|nr:survival of motor neuron-related-splicing factor 30 isoform X1 [Rosa chinensis]PRQ19660.1 putative chromatin remodeling & transcriptional activation CHROMO-DOMAIN family [Rosa chinensis]